MPSDPSKSAGRASPSNDHRGLAPLDAEAVRGLIEAKVHEAMAKAQEAAIRALEETAIAKAQEATVGALREEMAKAQEATTRALEEKAKAILSLKEEVKQAKEEIGRIRSNQEMLEEEIRSMKSSQGPAPRSNDKNREFPNMESNETSRTRTRLPMRRETEARRGGKQEIRPDKEADRPPDDIPQALEKDAILPNGQAVDDGQALEMGEQEVNQEQEQGRGLDEEAGQGQPNDEVAESGSDEREVARTNNDLKSLPFTDSTHSRLFKDEINLGKYGVHKVLRRDVFSSIWVEALQLASYFFLGTLVTNELEVVAGGHWDSCTLEMPLQQYIYYYVRGKLYDSLADSNITMQELPHLLRCSNSDDALGFAQESVGWLLWFHGSVIVFGVLLLLSFLYPDMVGAFILFKCPGWRPKTAAIVILVEIAAAMTIGAMGLGLALGGWIGYLDAFLLCVGVIFIHDVDEKVAVGSHMLFAVYNLRGRWPLERQFWIFWLVSAGCIFIVAVFVTMSIFP